MGVVKYLNDEERKRARRAQDNARHARDKEKRNLARKLAHAKNPERLRKIDRDRYKANPEHRLKIDRKRKYGQFAAEIYDEINNCQSCGDPVSGKNKHIDHDHNKEKDEAYRGILCGSCNCALGYLRDDETRILQLLKYLKSHKE